MKKDSISYELDPRMHVQIEYFAQAGIVFETLSDAIDSGQVSVSHNIAKNHHINKDSHITLYNTVTLITDIDPKLYAQRDFYNRKGIAFETLQRNEQDKLHYDNDEQLSAEKIAITMLVSIFNTIGNAHSSIFPFLSNDYGS